MQSKPQLQRTRWLRRVRHATAWFAIVGVAVALLIAVVVGNASPAKRVVPPVPATEPVRPAVHAARVRRRAVTHRAARRHVHHVAASRRRVVHRAVVTPPPPPPPPPVITQAAPVVVSGGS